MKLLGFDTETSGTLPEYALQPWRVRTGDAWLTCASVSVEAGEDVRATGQLMPTKDYLAAVLQKAVSTNTHIVTWNSTFDVAWLLAIGLHDLVYQAKWLDGMLLWKHLTNKPEFKIPGVKWPARSLEAAINEFYPGQGDFKEFEDFHATDEASLQGLLRRNIGDARFTLMLCRRFLTELDALPKTKRCALIEAQCIPMIAQHWLDGITIDLDAVNDPEEGLIAKTTAAANVAFVTLKLDNPEVTPEVLASPTQLSKLMFERWGLPILKRNAPTKTCPEGQPSTDKDTLELLGDRDPRAKLVRAYREGNNLRSKFGESTVRSVEYNGDGCTHPAFRIFGTYCVPGTVEVLTRAGWVALSEWGGGDIMQVRPDLSMEFLPAERFVGPTTDEWVKVDALRCMFTPGHTMPYLKQKTNAWATAPAEFFVGGSRQFAVPVAGDVTLVGSRWSVEQMRVFAMAQADGCFSRKGFKLTLVKSRKVVRAKQLLSDAGIRFREYVCDAYPDRTELHVAKSYVPEWLTAGAKTFGSWLLDTTTDGLKAFLSEIVHWDGSPHEDGGVKYGSTIRENTEWVATIAALLGRKSGLHAPEPQKSGSFLHVTHISDANIRPVRTVRSSKGVAKVEQNQRAYCATTQTGFWLARSEGVIFVTGNTGRGTYSSKQGRGKNERPTGVALHQWKRGALYRKVISVPEDCELLEFDFAGQEFRWMAVESRDDTMLGLCAPGEDAHSYMGARLHNTEYRSLTAAVKAEDKDAERQRKCGKFVNLSVQYRTSPPTLQIRARTDYQLKLSIMEATAFHATYQTTYLGVPRYWQRQIAFGRRNGYVETQAGRRVWLGRRDHYPRDWWWSYDSTTINFPIQGVGADQKYLAFMVLRNMLPKWGGRIYFELHDGLFVIVPKRHKMAAAAEIKHALSNLPYKRAWGVDLPIAFPVDCKAGPNWGSLHELEV